jgi:hypothetical protein
VAYFTFDKERHSRFCHYLAPPSKQDRGWHYAMCEGMSEAD